MDRSKQAETGSPKKAYNWPLETIQDVIAYRKEKGTWRPRPLDEPETRKK